MELKQAKSLKWAVYDSNGKVVIITSYKSIAINQFKKLSSDPEELV
jgi:hypothetical protein